MRPVSDLSSDLSCDRSRDARLARTHKARLLRGTMDTSTPSRSPAAPAHSPSPSALSPSDAPLVRHDWTVAEVSAIYRSPLFELIDRARAVHRAVHGGDSVQLCTLLSV